MKLIRIDARGKAMRDEFIFTAAAVVHVDESYKTLIIWGKAQKGVEIDSIIRAKLEEQYPAQSIINITVAEPPPWIEEYYQARTRFHQGEPPIFDTGGYSYLN